MTEPATNSQRLETGRMIYTVLILANSAAEALDCASSHYPESYLMEYDMLNGNVSPVESDWMTGVIRQADQASRDRVRRHWAARWDSPQSSLWVVQLTLVKFIDFTRTEVPAGAQQGEDDAPEAGEDQSELAADSTGEGSRSPAA